MNKLRAVPAAILAKPLPELRGACSRPTNLRNGYLVKGRLSYATLAIENVESDCTDYDDFEEFEVNSVDNRNNVSYIRILKP